MKLPAHSKTLTLRNMKARRAMTLAFESVDATYASPLKYPGWVRRAYYRALDNALHRLKQEGKFDAFIAAYITALVTR